MLKPFFFFFFPLFFQTQQINCKQSLLPEAAHLHGILNLKLLFRLGFRNDKHRATDGRNKQKEPKRSEIFICRSYKTCFAFNSSQRKPGLLLQNFASAFPGLKEERAHRKPKQKPRRKAEMVRKGKGTGAYLISEPHLPRNDGNNVHFHNQDRAVERK